MEGLQSRLLGANGFVFALQDLLELRKFLLQRCRILRVV